MADISGFPQLKLKSDVGKFTAAALQRQLGYADDLAAILGDPVGMAQDYWTEVNQSGSGMGDYIAQVTGNPNAKAQIELADRNRNVQGYNDFLAQILGPEGIAATKQAQAGAYGPGTLSQLDNLIALKTGSMGPKGQGSFLGTLTGGLATYLGAGGKFK